jgi:acetyl esterase/lipase
MVDKTSERLPSIERRIRAQLPLIRFLQTRIPFAAAGWLNKQAAANVRLDVEVRRESVFADGVPCQWLMPQDRPGDQVLLYFHGGGFVFGLTSLHLKMMAYLVKTSQLPCLMVDYRLAPAHPFPAALDDCITAYRWLLKKGFSGRNIVMGGDSAGGNLTLTTMMKLRDEGVELPAAAACLSPVADLSVRDHPSRPFKDPLIPPKAAKLYNISYVAGHDPRDPLISPVFGDWTGLPPLLIHAGEDEMLREDAVRVEKLARSAGVEVRLEVYPRMWHVWQLYLSLPQATQSLDDVAQFMNSYLGEFAPRVHDHRTVT